MNSDISLACNMDVFTPAERAAHIQTTMELIQSIQSIQGIESGYEFRFLSNTDVLARIAEFISKEQLCCPFLSFEMKVPPKQQLVSLTLTGPIGTQEFLREEFAGAFL